MHSRFPSSSFGFFRVGGLDSKKAEGETAPGALLCEVFHHKEEKWSHIFKIPKGPAGVWQPHGQRVRPERGLPLPL